jgi:hypothetical protein
VPAIAGILISPPGYRADLVDISASGLLAEWGVALKIGNAVRVTFEGTFVPATVQGQVVRSAVASMTATGLRYHVAIVFKAPIAFEDEPSPLPPAAADAQGASAPVSPTGLEPSSEDVGNQW